MNKQPHIVSFFFFLVFLLTIEIFAQTNVSIQKQIQMALVKHGFENVGVCVDRSFVLTTYENRIYRHEVRAIQEALALVSKFTTSQEKIVLIPQNRGIPLVAVTVDLDPYRLLADRKGRVAESHSQVEVSLQVEPYWPALKAQARANSSTLKFDVVVHPQFKARFGNYDEPVKSQINLSPVISTSLWKGMALSGQWILPLQNELGYEGDDDRPGLLTLNQTTRLPGNSFISATLGYFTQHRYGVDLETKKFWRNGRWAVGVNVGYTGYLSYLQNSWNYSDIDNLTYFFSGEYRLSKLDFRVKGTYGKFLYGDNGLRLDVLRQFGEVDIGFFALKSDGRGNVGFNFSIPIFPQKRMSPRRIRISPALFFPWGYRYRGLPTYGIQYTTENSIDAFMAGLNPGYTKKQIDEFENWQ